MENINLGYPGWFILVCVLIAALYAGILYYKDNKFVDKPKSLIFSLALLRFLSISFILFFLLEPYVKNYEEDIKKPLLIIAQDVSESIRIPYSADSLQKLGDEIIQLENNLSAKYDLRKIHFGEEVNHGLLDSFNQKASNFSKLFNYINEQYRGQTTAAIVLASDGIYNEGKNPVYTQNIDNIPIYPIALGDTTKKSDVSIQNIYHNKFSFLGDKIPIQFDLSSYGYSGNTAIVKVYNLDEDKVKPVSQKKVLINSNEFFTTENFIIQTVRAGTQHYRIQVQSLKDELSLVNNTRDIFIDVIDSKVKILILANAAHPDVSALKQTLESNKNYEVIVHMVFDNIKLANPDVVILHDLPSKTNHIEGIINLLKERKIPHLFIVGKQASLTDLSKVQDILDIKSNLLSSNEAQSVINNKFYSFLLDDNIKTDLEQFPPLIVPFGSIRENESSSTLLYQKIGNIKTDYPLLSFNDRNGLKTGILMGEGIWKWRIYNFVKHKDHRNFELLINKTIQYLAIKEDKRRWQVFPDKKILKENERIVFKANLYNDNFELINGSEAKMVITNKSGDNYNFVFTRFGNHYTLDAGYFPAGEYQFNASNMVNGKSTNFGGSFIVKALQIEQANLVARHDVLYKLSSMSGGKLYFPNQIDQLSDQLINADHKPIIYSREVTNKLLDFKWIFFIIIGLLGMEWFLRRYHGSY